MDKLLPPDIASFFVVMVAIITLIVNTYHTRRVMKSEVYQIKVDTQDELLAGILDSAARIKNLEDQFRRATRDIRTRDSKCVEVVAGIFENLFEL
jgi:hypothetical protein